MQAIGQPKEKATGIVEGMGWPSSVAGLNRHCLIASSAEELNPAEPLMIFAFCISPAASRLTETTTVPAPIAFSGKTGVTLETTMGELKLGVLGTSLLAKLPINKQARMKTPTANPTFLMVHLRRSRVSTSAKD